MHFVLLVFDPESILARIEILVNGDPVPNDVDVPFDLRLLRGKEIQLFVLPSKLGKHTEVLSLFRQ